MTYVDKHVYRERAERVERKKKKKNTWKSRKINVFYILAEYFAE